MIFNDTPPELYEKVLAFNSVMLEEHSSIELAAILVIQGLSFYKTVMSEEDYQIMAASIYENRNNIQSFI